MEIQAETAAGVTVATLSGRLDAQTATDAQRTLWELIDGGATRLVLDLGAVEYVSSAGLRILLTTAKKLSGPDRKLVLCALQPDVRKVFATSGLLGVFTVTDDAAAATALATG